MQQEGVRRYKRDLRWLTGAVVTGHRTAPRSGLARSRRCRFGPGAWRRSIRGAGPVSVADTGWHHESAAQRVRDDMSRAEAGGRFRVHTEVVVPGVEAGGCRHVGADVSRADWVRSTERHHGQRRRAVDGCNAWMSSIDSGCSCCGNPPPSLGRHLIERSSHECKHRYG